MKRFGISTLSLLLAGSLAGCFAGGDDDVGSDQQLIQGHVPLSQYSSKIVGVRVVANGQAVATAETDTAGNFNISVPRGTNYTLEVIAVNGSHTVLAGPLNGTSPTTFDVCDPGEDFDLGDLNPFDFEGVDGDAQPPGEEGAGCEIPPWICGDEGADGCWEEPLPCQDPASDPSFCYEEPPEQCPPGADPEDCFPTEPPPECNGTPNDCWPTEPPPEECPPDVDPEDCFPELPPEECPPGIDPEDCFPQPPFPCENPEDCFPTEPPCEGSPNDCWPTEPPPEQCPPGVDPEDCFPTEPPLPCDNPEDCIPTEPECDGNPQNCFPEEPFGGECTSAYDDPTCWPEPQVCEITPAGDFIGCDDDLGAAPDFPVPDFGCEAE